MLSYQNASTIFVSQNIGDDFYHNGFSKTVSLGGVGPFRSVERAINAVAELRVAGIRRPITIEIMGDYFLDDSIKIFGSRTPSCLQKQLHGIGVSNGITITSAKTEQSRIIGGLKIENWKHDRFNGHNCFSAEVPFRADGSVYPLTEFFVNGKRCKHTRYPKEGTLTAVDTENNHAETLGIHSKWFLAHKEDLADIENIEEATVNFYHNWIDEHSPIESYDRDTGKLTMEYQSCFAITTLYGDSNSIAESTDHPSALRYYLENVPATFGEPGEWYFNKPTSTVYYIPYENETPDQLEAYAPTVKRFVEIVGTPEDCVFDVTLKNLSFLYTDSTYVGIVDGVAAYGSDIQSKCNAHGAIQFENASRCTLQNCSVTGVGLYAVEIGKNCHDITVDSNRIDDCGAGGIKIFGGDADHTDEKTDHCTLSRNTISNGGIRYAAGCGIIVNHACNCSITNNTVYNFSYSGISVGWVWGYGENPTCGIRISYNDIHHIGTGKLSDMGGIYLLGRQPGTVVSYNRIHDVASRIYGGYGIYADEGTSEVLFENNVIYRVKCDCYHQHFGANNTVRNNIFALSGGCVSFGRPEMHCGGFLESNVFLTDGNPVYSGEHFPFTAIGCNNLFIDLSKSSVPVFIGNDKTSYSLEEFSNTLGCESESFYTENIFENLEQFDFTVSPRFKDNLPYFKPIEGFPSTPNKFD